MSSERTPRRVVILEPPGPHARERIAACYRAATAHGWIVEELCDAARGELPRAMEICRHTGASLLRFDDLHAEAVAC